MISPPQIFPKANFHPHRSKNKCNLKKTQNTNAMAFQGHLCDHLSIMLASHPLGCAPKMFKINLCQRLELSLGTSKAISLRQHDSSQRSTQNPNHHTPQAYTLKSQLMRRSFLLSPTLDQRNLFPISQSYTLLRLGYGRKIKKQLRLWDKQV